MNGDYYFRQYASLNGFVRVLAKYDVLQKDIGFYLAVILNILIICSFNEDNLLAQTRPSSHNFQIAFYVFSYLHLFVMSNIFWISVGK